jgi:hypothetical protein
VRYRIQLAPADVLAADATRFGAKRLDNLLAQSGLTVDRTVIERYCHWFSGSDYGWRSEWGDGRYRDNDNRRFSNSQFARHLGGQSSPGPRDDYRYSLHVKCKATRHRGRPYYWTRCLAIDLDRRDRARRPATRASRSRPAEPRGFASFATPYVWGTPSFPSTSAGSLHMEYRIQVVPADVLAADAARFRTKRLDNLLGTSGLTVDRSVLERYVHWFVGSNYGWRSEWGNGRYFDDGNRRFRTAQLADHLGGHRSPGPADDYRYSLHMKCKATPHRGQPYYWTRYLALDLDWRERAPQPLEERYERCCALFGTPLVLQSPGDGLHLYWPLAEPVSILGFLARGPLNIPVLLPDLLRAGGLVVAQGNVELLPTARQTLRLPLGGTSVQLDPSSLNAYPVSSRSAQVTLLVETMEQLALERPLQRADLLALAPQGERLPRTVSGTTAYLRLVPDGDGQVRIDVRRLLTEGLYAGVCRHEAAMALARHWMLTQGWTAAETVDGLLEWTRNKTNGLSNEAAELGDWRAAQRLQREYERICGGVVDGLRRGVVQRRRPARDAGSAVATVAEAERITDECADLSTPAARYWMEVFVHCLVGFAKRYGQRAEGEDADEDTVRVELSSKMMQLWPSCTGNAYRARLTLAESMDFAVYVRSYSTPTGRTPGRAKTYAVPVDVSSPPALEIDADALHLAAAQASTSAAKRVHPQQVAHALIAASRWTGDLTARYGTACARRIQQLVAAYAAALKELTAAAKAA